MVARLLRPRLPGDRGPEGLGCGDAARSPPSAPTQTLPPVLGSAGGHPGDPGPGRRGRAKPLVPCAPHGGRSLLSGSSPGGAALTPDEGRPPPAGSLTGPRRRDGASGGRTPVESPAQEELSISFCRLVPGPRRGEPTLPGVRRVLAAAVRGAGPAPSPGPWPEAAPCAPDLPSVQGEWGSGHWAPSPAGEPPPHLSSHPSGVRCAVGASLSAAGRCGAPSRWEDTAAVPEALGGRAVAGGGRRPWAPGLSATARRPQPCQRLCQLVLRFKA